MLCIGKRMDKNRIYFQGNPWPEGHPLKEFVWTAKVVDGDVWFDIHLETAVYYSERDIEDDDDIEYGSDWEAPIVWGNYHRCTMSTNYWHEGGFRVCKLQEYSADYLDGLELEVDMRPEQIEDWDDLAFHIYLLGHDAVAYHRIKFIREAGGNNFSIQWCGRAAQAYVGDDEFKHPFKLLVTDQKLPVVCNTSPSGVKVP